MNGIWFCIVLCAFVSTCAATYGVDVSTAVSKGDFECLKKNGYDFAIVRGYEETGRIDPNAAQTVKNAWAGGMAHVDVYLFPHIAGDPKAEIRNLWDTMHNDGAKFGMIWVDIELPSIWHKDKSQNVAFLNSMLAEGAALGANVGVYASKYMWEEIMGSSTIAHTHALWYAHYDNNPSFSDFTSFGGWSKPSIKQYKGTTAICGCGIDKNWY